MENLGEMEVEDLLQAIGEISVGAAILGLRQINISRRQFVADNPQAKPAVDAALDQIEKLAEPVSGAIGAVLSSLAEAVPGDHADRLRETGDLVASIGPELLRLSGLTKRD